MSPMEMIINSGFWNPYKHYQEINNIDPMQRVRVLVNFDRKSAVIGNSLTPNELKLS